MSTAFTSALYYSYIDIPDTEWLKTAALFRDSISTIVPKSIKHPNILNLLCVNDRWEAIDERK